MNVIAGLAVEDEELLQTVVHDALEERGFDVVISASADEALTLFHSGVAKYSALVSDVNLKGAKNGWELARQVREINPAFPVVYITGAAADEWGSQGVPNSILLEKPFATRTAGHSCFPGPQQRWYDNS